MVEASGSKPSSAAGLLGVVVLGLAGLGVYAARTPLDKVRPPAPARRAALDARPEALPARLWEDPVARVVEELDRVAAIGEAAERSAARAAVVDEVAALGLDASWLVLGVLVQPGDYGEDAENRIRTRYAVHSALAVEGFEPEEAGQLGVLDACGAAEASCGGEPHGPLELLPFERFRRPAGGPAVLVLWVPDDLGPDPSESLHGIAKAVSGGDRLPRLAFLGPTSSQTLLDVVEGETERPRSHCGCLAEARSCAMAGATLLVTWATSDATALEALATRPGTRHDPVAGTLELPSGLVLRRAITTDARLVELLVDELLLRGIDLGTEPVAIFTEWGSSYSRTFYEGFVRRVREVLGGREPAVPVARLSYELGIDGVVPGEEDPGVQEAPTGRSQVDYVRRLQREFDRREEHYAAIGIVGTDVYDKLLLLRALRREFPAAILFTTDADARYLEEAEYGSTRNLLIASHFGIAPERREGEPEGGPASRVRTLPFRDAYQTSNYEGVRALLAQLPASTAETPPTVARERAPGEDLVLLRLACWLREQASRWIAAIPPEPELDGSAGGSPVRLYEVGRSGLVRLGAVRSQAGFPRWLLALASLAALLAVAAGRHLRGPRPHTPGGAVARLGWSLALAGCLLLAAVIAADYWRLAASLPVLARVSALGLVVVGFALLWRVLDWTSEEGREPGAFARVASRALPLACLVGLAMGAVFVVAVLEGRGEPLVLLQGVNVWPTILVRALVVVVVVVCSVELKRDLERADARTARAFGLAGRGREDPPSELRSWFAIPRRRTSSDALLPAWEWYRGAARNRRLRSLVAAVGFGVLLFFVYHYERQGFRHARGAVAFELERWTWGLSLAAVAWLLFYTLDATLICRGLILPFVQGEGFQYWQDPDLRTIAGVPLPLPRPGEAGAVAPDPERPASLHLLRVVRFVAAVTESISRLAYYPFVLLCALVLAQSGLFENWSWPLTSLLLYAVCALAVLAAAVALRFAAEGLRRHAVRRLREEVLVHRMKNETSKVDELEHAIADVQSLRRGAFLPLLEHPVVTAALIPFGGAGTVALLEVLRI